MKKEGNYQSNAQGSGDDGVRGDYGTGDVPQFGAITPGAILGKQTVPPFLVGDGLILNTVPVPIPIILPADNAEVSVDVSAIFPGLVALGVPVYVLNSQAFTYGSDGLPVCLYVAASALNTIVFGVVNFGGLATTGLATLNVDVAVNVVAS